MKKRITSIVISFIIVVITFVSVLVISNRAKSPVAFAKQDAIENRAYEHFNREHSFKMPEVYRIKKGETIKAYSLSKNNKLETVTTLKSSEDTPFYGVMLLNSKTSLGQFDKNGITYRGVVTPKGIAYYIRSNDFSKLDRINYFNRNNHDCKF